MFRFKFKDEDFSPDFYQRLGIEQFSENAEIIKKAYKKRSRETHPDLNPELENAEKQFVAVSRANEVLKDPELKEQYDRLLQARLDHTPRAPETEAVDYTAPEHYEDITYDDEELQKYKEASNRLSTGTARSGDLSTVFNFHAGNGRPQPSKRPTPQLNTSSYPPQIGEPTFPTLDYDEE